MFRKAIATLAFGALILGSASAHAEGKHYADPVQAEKVCKSPVVWVNPSSGIYHLPGSHNYGTTKSGYFMCQKAADSAGYKESGSK